MTKPIPTTPAGDPATLKDRVRAFEREQVREAIERHQNLSRAARELGMSPAGLHHAVRRLGLDAEYDAVRRGPGAPTKS